MNPEAYDRAANTIRFLMKTLWRTKSYGSENVPLDGPVIIACNHMSYLDPPGMGVFAPRRIQYMAKKELFDIPFLGGAIAKVGAYPVDRQGSAKSAIKRSLEVLQAGGAIGIFPEGTRNLSGEVEPQIGAALLASLSKAPVVPACILGSERWLRFPQIKVAFGPPLRLPADRKATHEDLAKFTAEIMSAINALREKLQSE